MSGRSNFGFNRTFMELKLPSADFDALGMEF